VAAAPAIPYLILGLAALVSLLVAGGLQKGYSYTFALMFVKLAETAEKVRIPTTFHTFRPLKPLGDALRWVNRVIFAMLGVWIATSERGVSYFFSALAQIINWAAHELAQLAKSTFRMGRGILARASAMVRDLIRHYVRPLVRAMIRTALKPLRAVARFLWRRIKWIAYLALRALRAGLTALRYMSRYLLRRLLRFERFMLRRLAHFARRIWTLLRLRKLLRAMIRALKWEAIVLRALGRLGLGWLRATNVIKFGKFLMRQGLDWADMVLALLSPVAGTMSLREFAHFMVSAEDEIKQATTRFWQVDA
jgi:hypothetical protein